MKTIVLMQPREERRDLRTPEGPPGESGAAKGEEAERRKGKSELRRLTPRVLLSKALRQLSWQEQKKDGSLGPPLSLLRTSCLPCHSPCSL